MTTRDKIIQLMSDGQSRFAEDIRTAIQATSVYVDLENLRAEKRILRVKSWDTPPGKASKFKYRYKLAE